MFSITQGAVPDDALLKTYPGGAHPERWRQLGDCFAISVDRVISLAEFVFAFYTSPEFRFERVILALSPARHPRTPKRDRSRRVLPVRLPFGVWENAPPRNC